jgi:hypothetical protein
VLLRGKAPGGKPLSGTGGPTGSVAAGAEAAQGR